MVNRGCGEEWDNKLEVETSAGKVETSVGEVETSAVK